MSVLTVLREAKAICKYAHTATQLAVDANGMKVRNPIAPSAVAWSSVGALIKVAPGNPSIVAENRSPGHTVEAHRAFLLLEDAAVDQGCANTVEVDRAGFGPVMAMFDRAMQLAPDVEPARRKPAAGTGSAPRGQRAV